GGPGAERISSTRGPLSALPSRNLRCRCYPSTYATAVMAGLDPATQRRAQLAPWLGGSTSWRTSYGTIYVGVTSDLARRAYEHKNGLVPGFTSKYGLTDLVYCEFHDRIEDAIQREHNIKHWRRAW